MKDGIRVFNPMQEALAARSTHKRSQAAQWRKRGLMCWTCKQEKPRLGGVFPGRGNGGLRMACEQFRCADCEAARKAKREAIKVVTT